jgi:hypothetical protein
MSWNELDIDSDEYKQQIALAKEKQLGLAKAYKRLFSTEDGKKVLNNLSEMFIYNNNTSLDAINVNYSAAYHNGESGVVKYCHSQISAAEMKQ